MKIWSEQSLENFEAWSGGKTTLDNIINAGNVQALESVIEELHPDGINETELNDILWFEKEWCYEVSGTPNPYDEEEESEDDENEE